MFRPLYLMALNSSNVFWIETSKRSVCCLNLISLNRTCSSVIREPLIFLLISWKQNPKRSSLSWDNKVGEYLFTPFEKLKLNLAMILFLAFFQVSKCYEYIWTHKALFRRFPYTLSRVVSLYYLFDWIFYARKTK